MRPTLLLVTAIAACGVPPSIDTRTVITVTGNVDGREPIFAGAGWAWERPRVELGALGVDNYEFHVVLTNAPMDPLVSLETLPAMARHDLAREAGLGDFLHVAITRRGVGEEVDAEGSYPEADALNDTAAAELALGAHRAANEPPAATILSRPFQAGQISSWQLRMGGMNRPSRDEAGAVDGLLSIDMVEGNTALGGLDIDLQVPMVGEGFGLCQVNLLLAPEGTNCLPDRD